MALWITCSVRDPEERRRRRRRRRSFSAAIRQCSVLARDSACCPFCLPFDVKLEHWSMRFAI